MKIEDTAPTQKQQNIVNMKTEKLSTVTQEILTSERQYCGKDDIL